MPSKRYSLIGAILALTILTTPLLNLFIAGDSNSVVLRLGASLFLFWLALIIFTIIANKFHDQEAASPDSAHAQDIIKD